ncbi:MAG: FixH family protein [Desulfobacteraceae bacterium]|nr:FixH family protein [Desulfobacteraceae bacterium]
MKRQVIVISALLLLLMAGGVYAKHAVMTKKADGYTIGASFEKAPPATGANVLLITVKDGSGKKVADATVEVEYFMARQMIPTGKSIEMPHMGTSATAAPSGAGYRAGLDFSMPGRWHVVVKVNQKGKTAKADFPIQVR